MGDVTTHAEITAFVAQEARRTIPDGEIPEGDYVFLELGNFLTDVSQFRDPVALHRGRDIGRARAADKSYNTAQYMGSNEWSNEVFGTKGGGRHGALPEMLRALAEGLTHLMFDSDGLPVLGAVLGLVAPGGPPPLIPTHGIPPATLTTALGTHFTQYYPHEHLDFPPSTTPMAQHRTDRLFTRGPRGLISYLEWFIDYLGEELTRLEHDWVRARAAGITAAQRQDFLIRLGHLLHPIEDFFFHSNLLEVYQWRIVRAAHPQADPNVLTSLKTLVDDGLTGTRLDPGSVSLRRRLHRRLRYPTFLSDTQLSTTASDLDTDMVYTGGFGQTDVSHTLGGALEGIESKLDILPPSHDPRRTHLVFFRLLLSQKERQDMVRGDLVEKHQQTHREQLRAGELAKAITGWESIGLLCSHAATRLRDAFALDLKVSERHKGVLYDFPGPGGVFINLLEQMQRERDASSAARQKLDSSPASMYAISSDNSASDERVGTHSLLSKDSTEKEPMRPEALAFAKHASASVATILLNRVRGPAPVSDGIDWDSVLRFFLRAPATAGGTWEAELLTAVRATPRFQQPPVASVTQQPQVPLLGLNSGASKLASRRAGPIRASLEAYYEGFETDPQ